MLACVRALSMMFVVAPSVEPPLEYIWTSYASSLPEESNPASYLPRKG